MLSRLMSPVSTIHTDPDDWNQQVGAMSGTVNERQRLLEAGAAEDRHPDRSPRESNLFSRVGECS